MLELLSSWMLSLWVQSPEPQSLRSSELATWVNSSTPDIFFQTQFDLDPVAIAAIEAHLDALTDAGVSEQEQSVWFQSGRQVIGDYQGTVPLPAASLTKIATTLVAIATWGVDHQFETLLEITGPIENGVLWGDLVVRGGSDPFFVWEEAIALGNALNEAGIEWISGDLIITGNFVMNYELDPATSGRLFQQAIHSGLWSRDVDIQYQAMAPDTQKPRVLLDGQIWVLSEEEVSQLDSVPLIQHHSLPLIKILKLMNVYSNNFMADVMADALGGPQNLAQQAADLAGVPVDEIQLINGSGLGEDNRISARATSAMLMAIQESVQSGGFNMADLLPVIGRDVGTLRGRQLPTHAALKTGTLAAVSSLAGVIPTGDRDLVWFTIINRGPSLDRLRSQQDILIKDLMDVWKSPVELPPSITPKPYNPTDRLGNPDRNQIL